MAWTKGFNFRQTSGYVTDTGNNTYVIKDTYPTTRNGVTFGWDSSVGMDMRDRNASVDERFAGSNFNNIPYSYRYFRVDLPATGQYVIRLSMGDYSYSQAVQFAFLDDASVLTSGSRLLGAANRYNDATNVERTSPSDWISNNASYTGTFTSTIFNLRVGDGGASTYGGSVTHLWIDQIGSAHDLTGDRTLAAAGRATLVGDPNAFIKYWRIPSNASNGTTGRMIVFASGNPPTTVAYEGAVTADANGNFDLLTTASDAAGTKRFAVVHAWNGVTGTTSIYGGPAIGEVIVT